jgi:hypothetical protein
MMVVGGGVVGTSNDILSEIFKKTLLNLKCLNDPCKLPMDYTFLKPK